MARVNPPQLPATFSAATRSWFTTTFATPTAAQQGAWASINDHHHTLVVAPTGSGKTLAAFLAAVDRLLTTPAEQEPQRRCRVVYISPLKALAADVQRNLRQPLAGIRHASATHSGQTLREITVAMRTGDTPAAERRRFARHGADILITTPESLFLLLTSAAHEMFAGVDTVIVDEVHALAGNKRGAHLALSLERLDALLPRPAQRIGLSATVHPVAEVARFLAPSAPVQVVAPPATKQLEISVSVPVPDMTELGSMPPSNATRTTPVPDDADVPSIWPAIAAAVFDHIRQHQTSLVFVNSRGIAERLCARLNELAAAESTPLDASPKRMPATMMAQSGAADGAPPTIARAHHGSVSQAERREIEEALKAGTLPAVVATSSLELGIDMGAIDLVIQIETPPSVASGLQRVGRAGHQVDAVSTGIIFPKHRGDILAAAVVAEHMRRQQIEPIRIPRNPLDVLAQQLVAMVAIRPQRRDELAAVVRRAAPFTELTDAALDAVLDMLAGRYPSDDFARLRPRLTWDRGTHLLTARPGAKAVVVASAGTIPDRGMYGVYLADGDRNHRVGELEEEMVYESRVGDVFLLGATSWRIVEINVDRVLVQPAPGRAARMPFWKGDSIGRPLALATAIGTTARELVTTDDTTAINRLTASGLDKAAIDNLRSYLHEQQASALPDDRTIVVERFRDEVGDWRLVLHSIFGAPVNAGWALAIAGRLRDRYGIDPQVLPTDDAIVIRLPDLDPPPSSDVLVFSADDIEAEVAGQLTGSALFAGRFRECASRALLLPRHRPGRRMPLWQQRHRAAQLLDGIIGGSADGGLDHQLAGFPIIAETMRECLTEVLDLPGLQTVLSGIGDGLIRIVEVETPRPSPFARSALLSYVGAFLYDGDAPAAERRLAALTVDPTLLGELLGQGAAADDDPDRDLVDPEVAAQLEQRLQWLDGARSITDVDGLTDLLRDLGPLTTVELQVRGASDDLLRAATDRIVEISLAGARHWIVPEDASRLRDALGIPIPSGVPAALHASVADPAGDLVGRYARTRGPFTAADCAARLGMPASGVVATLQRLADAGRVVSGRFLPELDDPQWCQADVLRSIRRHTIAALRREIEPVTAVAFAAASVAHVRGGSPGATVEQAMEQLRGTPVPASTLERQVLRVRFGEYQEAQLDELLAAGELVWAGAGSLAGSDGRIVLAPAADAPLLLPLLEPPSAELDATVLQVFDRGALFFRELVTELPSMPPAELGDALWRLVWSGHLTNDTFAPVRARLAGTSAPAAPAIPARVLRRRGFGGYGGAGRTVKPTLDRSLSGRWSRTPARETEPTRRLYALADALLDRHVVVSRGTLAAEQPIPGGFAALYPVLAAMEQRGQVRRGYFVAGLGGLQFADAVAIDALRRTAPTGEPVVLAATDSANPYGATLPWPGHDAGRNAARRAGASVVVADGELLAYLDSGGRRVLRYVDDAGPIAEAIAAAHAAGYWDRLTIEQVNDVPVQDDPLGTALVTAGFRLTPRGLRA